MKKNARYLYLATTLVFCAALAAIAAMSWLVYDWNEKRNALSDLELSYANAAQKNTYAASARVLLRDIETERKQLGEINANSDPVEIIHFIEGVGKSAHVSITINSVNPGSTYAKDPSLNSFVIAITGTGSFSQLNHFVSLLETIPLPSLIEKVKFEKHDRDWNVEVLIRVFTEEAQS